MTISGGSDISNSSGFGPFFYQRIKHFISFDKVQYWHNLILKDSQLITLHNCF